MVYLIHRDGTNIYKVGFSKNPEKRLKTLQTGNAEKLILIKQWYGDRDLEKIIHDKLRPDIIGRQQKLKGEWFKISSEWVNVILFEIRTKMGIQEKE